METYYPTRWIDIRPGLQQKAILGGRCIFKRCCGLGMRRVLMFQKEEGKPIKRLGTGIPFHVGYHCEVCGNVKHLIGDQ